VTSIVQGARPEQAAEPLHPANANPAAGTGVKVTNVAELKAAAQVAPPAQLMPAGALLTKLAAAPNTVTETLNCWAGGGPKFAVTDWLEFRVTVHPPVPAHAPLHPVKADPGLGVAVRVTTVPPTKLPEQAVGQAIPAGVLLAVPPLEGET
jgi:hypothetical protein